MTFMVGLWIGAALGYLLCGILSSGARADERAAIVLEREGAVRERLDSGAAKP